MKFSPLRAAVFFVIGLPVGFILAALGFAVARAPIEAGSVFPWALGLAAIAGLAGGLKTPAGPTP